MPERSEQEHRQIFYWQRMGLSVRKAYKMHAVSGHLTKVEGAENWRNVPEHCLVEAARSKTLGRWIGLPEPLVKDMTLGAMLEDFRKRSEIKSTQVANLRGESPLAAVTFEEQVDDDSLRIFGFGNAVRRLAGATGGLVPQLVESQRLLDQPNLSDEDWAYLIVHYVDDCSIGSDWVRPSEVTTDGRYVNIIDFKERALRDNPNYGRISIEVTEELAAHPQFSGMENLQAWATVSKHIEQRLTEKINERTGETIEPYLIPELVDQKIAAEIETFRLSPRPR